MKRRLAAILAADIADYNRLMGEDEAATVRDLKGHQAVVLPLVGRYGAGLSTPPATGSWPSSRA
jgi:class 3 adenylate cyclase